LNYCAEIAYDGTHFSGWQRQINAHTLQEEIENAISKILQEEITVLGCGRTDSGVHARSYFLNFKTNHQELNDQFIYKLNYLLPTTIVFECLWQVQDDFSARFDAESRSYKYYLHQEMNPFLNAYSLFYGRKLNIAAMNKACTFLLGRQDFKSFSKAKTEVNNFFCQISKAHWEMEGEQLVFTIQANRFLRNMVRAVVGTLLEIGEEKKEPEHVIQVIKDQNRSSAGKSVAAHALFLEEIKYNQSLWQKRT